MDGGESGERKSTSWGEYYQECRAAAKSLISLGLGEHEAVAIRGFNSPEWFAADMGAVIAGGVAAGVYTTNGPDATAYIVNHAGAKIVFVENEIHMGVVLAARDSMPQVETIVQWSGDVNGDVPGAMSWAQFLDAGKDVEDAVLDQRMDAIRPGHCATLIYTSGTTGNPKSVMVSHDNLTWTAVLTFNTISKVDDEHLISFLPLSHIAAQMLDLVGPIIMGATIHFARPDALRGTLFDTVKEVRPTIFLAVPRLWEKLQTKLTALMTAKAKAAAAAGETPAPLPEGALAAMLGLDRCHYCATAAAPIALSTLQFFDKIGFHIHSIYGLSECTGPLSVSTHDNSLLGAVGPAIPSTLVKLVDPDEGGNGEICAYGRHIFMGYKDDPEASAAAIDTDGYLHTGDLGKFDDNGFLFITGRIKELLITAGGENVAPVPIEQKIKDNLALVSNAIVIGDQRKFLSCLITIKSEIDMSNGKATDALAPEAAAILAAIGSDASTVTEAINDPKVTEYIQAGIDVYNEKGAVSRAQNIRKWVFLPVDVSIGTGELTPTQKLQRRKVYAKYGDLIDSMYE